MRKIWRLSLLVATSCAATLGAQAAPQRWTRVTTTAGFSVDKPMDWRPLGAAGDRVDIVSGPCRRDGAIICDGEAEILVRSEPTPAKRKVLRAKACWSLQEALSETTDAAGRRLRESRFSCTIADRRFVIIERHWKGDKRAPSYGRTAMRMAKSLRYPG